MTAVQVTPTARPACWGVNPELFYGPVDTAAGEPVAEWERWALLVCAGCPVRAGCLAEALLWPVDEQHGVIGGATAAQRQAMLATSRQESTRTSVREKPTSRAIALYEAGMGPRGIARQLRVNERRVHRWLQRHRAGQVPVSHRPGVAS